MMATSDPSESFEEESSETKKMPETKHERIRLCIENLVYEGEKEVETRRKNGAEFLLWAHKHAAVSVQSSDIPEGILPSPYSGRIHDLRAYSKARGPDDVIYDTHADLRENLARGNLILELEGGSEDGRYIVLRALRKFTGGEIWDDDDRCDASGGNVEQKDAWLQYFTSSVSDAKRLVSTRKMNGEAAHLSALKLDNEWLLVVGSKNTHIVVHKSDDIASYKDGRFRVARIFAHHILNCLGSLKEQQREGLLKFLWRHSLTAVFEILMPDHQHVENLSSIESYELKFIAWTHNEGGSSFTALPVDVGLQVAKKFGLDPTEHEIINPRKLNEHMTKVLRAYGSEGVVLYFLDDNDNTIGLLKKKTAWYILCRAIREKAKGSIGAFRRSPQTFSLAAQQKKMERRLEDIATWLKLTPEIVDRWRNLSSNFLNFCIQEYRKNSLTLDDVANMFPVAWKNFLDQTGNDDCVFQDNCAD